VTSLGCVLQRVISAYRRRWSDLALARSAVSDPPSPFGGTRLVQNPHRIVYVSTFVFRLKAPRPTFALDMTDEERAVMARHAAYWQPMVDSGRMVIFGPVLDESGSWGLGVVEADDEEEIRAFAGGDPAVTSGTAEIEVGKLLAGYVRPG
jgi:uncharacterized protein